MKSFRLDKKSLQIDESPLEFEFPISEIVFLKNVFCILFEPGSDNRNWGQFHNLYGININGKIIWKADLPSTKPDCYWKIKLIGENLRAYSFSSYDCIIDPITGKILSSEFYK